MRYGLLILLVVVQAASVCAQSTSLREDLLDWYSTNYGEIQRGLENGDDFLFVPVVFAVCELWKSGDGAIGSEVAPAIARPLINQPALTLHWFEDHLVDFEAWLDRMPYDLLTDYNGKWTKELESLRIALVSSLSEFSLQTEGESLAQMATDVARRAEDNGIRQVD